MADVPFIIVWLIINFIIYYGSEERGGGGLDGWEERIVSGEK